MQGLRNLPLRVWTVLPLTIIFGAAAFRLSWNIVFSTTGSGEVLWWVAIGATVTGYFFCLRFLSRPIPAEKLRGRGMRIGAIICIAGGLGIATAYLIQQIPFSIAPVSKVVLGLSFAVVIGGYFFLALLVSPGLFDKLKTRPARIAVSAVATMALLTLSIHTARFLPSPLAEHPFSQTMAILLLAALIATYPLILVYIWRVWRRRVD
jgi:hypothetical protein